MRVLIRAFSVLLALVGSGISANSLAQNTLVMAPVVSASPSTVNISVGLGIASSATATVTFTGDGSTIDNFYANSSLAGSIFGGFASTWSHSSGAGSVSYSLSGCPDSANGRPATQNLSGCSLQVNLSATQAFSFQDTVTVYFSYVDSNNASRNGTAYVTVNGAADVPSNLPSNTPSSVQIDDEDGDGIDNGNDLCPNTTTGSVVDSDGCAESEVDGDFDGVPDITDQCPGTPALISVDDKGCSEPQRQVDSDGDSVVDSLDQCPNTPAGSTVDSTGCANEEKDDDADGVLNGLDECPATATGAAVDSQGCAPIQIDGDLDGVINARDSCPNTPSGSNVNGDGCAQFELDDDQDGVANDADQCPTSPVDESVNSSGCAASELDSDADGVNDAIDQCPNTPVGESVNATGCAESELDDDNDGVANDRDQCPNSPNGEAVNDDGCAPSQLDRDGDGVADFEDVCPDEAGDGEDGCPSYEQTLSSLLDAAGADQELQTTAGAVADSCTSDVSGQLVEDCRALLDASLSGAEGVDSALNEITPERATQANASVQKSNTVQNRNIGDRISALRGGSRGVSLQGLSFNVAGQQLGAEQLASWADELLLPASGASGDAEEPMLLANSRWGMFLSGELSKAERDAKGSSSGFEVDSTVLTGGIDYRVSDRFVLGGALSFITGDTDLADNKGYVDSDGISVTLYGSYYLDKFYMDFSVSAGQSDFEQSRRIGYVLGNGTQVGQFMLADYEGSTTSAFVGVGWDLLQTEWLVSLRATLDYLDSQIDSFTERASDPTGSGAGWAVIMDEQNQDWLTGRLTGSVNRVISASWGVLIPYVELDLVQEFGNDPFRANAHFVADPTGQALQVLSEDPDSSYMRGRLGASVQLPNGLSGFLDYGRLFAYDRWSEYTISGGLRYEF